jgi:threonine dehydrogenase-like Zn-dependent dehydrogenase
MGHEIGGTVLECQSRPELVGHTATVYPVLSCGLCEFCAGNQQQLCASAEIIGVSPALQGAFAEMMVVPAANIVPMPSASPVVAGLVEPFAVGLHASQLGQVVDKSVLVVGAGAIGLMVITACRKLGAKVVFATDIAADRSLRAQTFGARVPSAEEADALAWVRTSNGGPVDVVIDAVGSSDSLATSLSAVRLGGTVVVVGMGQPRVEVGLFDIVTKERTVIGSFCYGRSTFERASRWLADGVDGVDNLVAAVVELREAEAALTSLAAGSERAPRIMISPSGQCTTPRERRAPSSLRNDRY